MKALFLVVVLAATFAAGGAARTTGGPFYLVPSPTKECKNVKNCVGATGPWVAVPAGATASYLFGCPTRIGHVVGGTDVRVSSKAVRVWYEGKPGGPVGIPVNPRGAAMLLFHAVVSGGKAGSFQPILGCVSLASKNKRSTVSAVPGTSPAVPNFRAEQLQIRLSTGEKTLACGTHEQVVSSWTALAFNTQGPPPQSYLTAVTVEKTAQGRKVHVSYQVLGNLLEPLAPRSYLQVGAACES